MAANIQALHWRLFAASEITMWPFKATPQPKEEHTMQEEWAKIPETERSPLAIYIEPFLAYWRSLPSMYDLTKGAPRMIIPPTGRGGITRIEEDSTEPKPRFDPKLITEEYR